MFLYGTPLNTIEAIEKLVEQYRNKHPQAIINHVLGEQFTISLVRAIKEDALEQYTKSLSACDPFIFEGAEHLGGKVMTMKVLFEKDTFRLLGAQIVGFDGVDKRIDVIAGNNRNAS